MRECRGCGRVRVGSGGGAKCARSDKSDSDHSDDSGKSHGSGGGGGDGGGCGGGCGTCHGESTCDGDGQSGEAKSKSKCVLLTGRVVRPDSPEYELARQNNIKFFDNYPSIIVFAQNVVDIQNAICYARQHELTLRIRSGRNSISGSSNGNSFLIIDVSEIKFMRIDKRKERVYLGGGVTQGEVLDFLADSGYFTAAGSERALGFGPVVLGGGIGLLSRIKGPGCDSAIEFDTVLADGTLARANREENCDLYWASRGGGGGNFGVVAGLVMRLYKAPKFVVSFKASWPISSFLQAYNVWQHWARKQGDRMGSNTTLLGSGTFNLVGVFLGTLRELGRRLAPLRAVPNGTWTIEQEPFGTWYRSSSSVETPFQHYTSGWVFRPLPKKALRIVQNFMMVAPSPQSTFFSLSWGLNTRDVPKGGTAFPTSHRNAIMYCEASCEFDDPLIRGSALAWNGQFRDAMRPWFFGSYVNVQQTEVLDWPVAYYGRKNYQELKKVKVRYDPDDVFSGPQSIPACTKQKQRSC